MGGNIFRSVVLGLVLIVILAGVWAVKAWNGRGQLERRSSAVVVPKQSIIPLMNPPMTPATPAEPAAPDVVPNIVFVETPDISWLPSGTRISVAEARIPFAPDAKYPGVDSSRSTSSGGLPSRYLASLGNVDASIIAWVGDWEAQAFNGEKATSAKLEVLRDRLKTINLPFNDLYAVGKAIDEIGDRAVAAPFYVAAVGKAESDISRLERATPEAKRYGSPMHQMYKSLESIGEFAPCRKIWHLQSMLAAPGSQQDFLCRFMEHEMQCSMGEFAESAKAFAALASEYDRTSLVSEHAGFRAEMDYMMGFASFRDNAYDMAVEPLVRSTQQRGNHSPYVYELLTVVCAKAGRIAESEEYFARWKAESARSPSDALQFAMLIQQAKLEHAKR